MTQLRTPKFWLLTTAALLLGSQLPAQAQVSSAYTSNYDYGAPTMISAAPRLPSIPAEQIARDVTSDYNPRTGQTEFAGQPFDPFEDDPNLAGSLRLRSGSGGTAINGQPLQDGVLVDVDFYYNSPSDDPYGGRNYSDASFVNGQLAPVVVRDTRILECSTRVDNVIYDQGNYYNQAASFGGGIYRPQRYYAGHSGYGFGFGSSYFGPGISYYNTNRNNFSRIRSVNRSRNVRSNLRDDRRDQTRNRDRIRDRDGDRTRDRDRIRDRDGDRTRDRDRNRSDYHVRSDATPRTNRRDQTSLQERNRLRATRYHNSTRASSRGVGRSTFRPATRSERSDARTVTSQAPSGTSSFAPQSSRSDTSRQSETRDAARSSRNGRSFNRRTTGTTTPTRSSATSSRPSQPTTARSTSPKRLNRGTVKAQATDSKSTKSNTSSSKKAASSKKTSSSKKSFSSKKTNSRSSRSKDSSKSRSSSSNRNSKSRSFSSRNRKNRQLDFFPQGSYGGRQVVTNQSVDCAREDKLRVFVSNARLDAARFDGLTLIALDAQGGETPIYIPPNYIEGFRMASAGRIGSQGDQPQQPAARSYAPVPQNRPQPLPQQRLEAAPCPAGTSPQADGTCLQNRVTGYPSR